MSDNMKSKKTRTTFCVSCSIIEYEKIKRLAKRRGMTLSGYVLWQCIKEAQK